MAKSKEDKRKDAPTRSSARLAEKKKRRQRKKKRVSRRSSVRHQKYESSDDEHDDVTEQSSATSTSDESSESSESSSSSSSSDEQSSNDDRGRRCNLKYKRRKGRGYDKATQEEATDYMQKLMVLSLLQKCANLKMQRGRTHNKDVYTSSEEEDRREKCLLVMDGTGSDDSDYEPPRKRRRRGIANDKLPAQTRRAARKALGKLRGGTLTAREERFLKQLPLEKCETLAKQAMAVTRRARRDVPLAIRVLAWDVPERTKGLICERLTRLESMEPGEGEYAKLASWVSELEALPIGKLSKLPVNAHEDSADKVAAFLTESRGTLDSAVFGHKNLKDEVIRLLAQWIRNPNAPTQTLAIQGPPGNGKTTLVKDGLAKVMGRPFVFIALGGSGDASFIHGHDYTWEGSRPGRIADGLKSSGVMNPVFFLDELDKLSDTARGREIQQTLVHLLDGTQNAHFVDRFFAGVHLDMSRAVFVVSFNDPSKVDSVLLDRMRVVRTKGFPVEDKVKIASKFLVPAVLKEVGLSPDAVTFDDSAIQRIVRDYTRREKGVRSLRRCIHHICSEVNLQWLLKKTPGDTGVVIKVADVEKYLASLRSPMDSSHSMYL